MNANQWKKLRVSIHLPFDAMHEIIIMKISDEQMAFEAIKKEIEVIKARNKRVEADKGWETSWTRRVFIAVVTYFVAAVWLLLIGDTYPLLKAFVPAVGYIFSTLSLPFVKKWWMQYKHLKQ